MTLVLSFSLFVFLLGLYGLYNYRKHILFILICLELILVSINLNFVCISVFLDDFFGQIVVLLILTVAAAETAIGLAILVVYYRLRGGIQVELLSLLKSSFAFILCPIDLLYFIPSIFYSTSNDSLEEDDSVVVQSENSSNSETVLDQATVDSEVEKTSDDASECNVINPSSNCSNSDVADDTVETSSAGESASVVVENKAQDVLEDDSKFDNLESESKSDNSDDIFEEDKQFNQKDHDVLAEDDSKSNNLENESKSDNSDDVSEEDTNKKSEGDKQSDHKDNDDKTDGDDEDP